MGNLNKALETMEAFVGLPAASSRIMEYPSWGFSGADFLNSVIRFDIPQSGASPQLFLTALLKKIKEVEKALGRDGKVVFNADGSRLYSDRTIDIDILFYGSTRIETDILTVPHPLIKERDFVMEPLADVATKKLKNTFPLYFQI